MKSTQSLSLGYVLVTGASQGIGLELARVSAEHRHNLIIVARDLSRLEEVAREIRKKYTVDVKVFAHDLEMEENVHALVKEVENLPIDILVNNVGFAVYGPFAENDIPRVMGSIALNVGCLTLLTRLLLPQLIASQGKILNVASTAAFQPGPLMAVYFATKAYVVSFGEALRYELRHSPKDTGVSVTTLCPGATATAFQDAAHFGNSNIIKLVGMMSAREVAIIGFAGLMKNKSIVIPGLKNKIGSFFARFMPRSILLPLLYKLNKTDL